MPSRSFSVLLSVCCLVMLTFSQEKEKEQQLKEFVRVVNVEMVVRVMEKGKPVGGLKKDDFTLLEDGQQRQINGFFEVRRRIAPQPPAADEKAVPVKTPGRFFLIFFWINEPEVKFADTLDYFFRDIYRENDRVLLASANKIFAIETPEGKDDALGKFKKNLADQCRSNQIERQRTVRTLEEIFQEYMFVMQNVRENRNLDLPVIARKTFVQKYIDLQKEFRLRSLTPHLSSLESLARGLEDVSADKWAFVFYQRDAMPVFNLDAIIRYASEMGLKDDDMSDLRREFDRTQFDREFIKEASGIGDFLRTRFIQANAQFHLLLLDSRQAQYIDQSDTHISLAMLSTVFSNWEAVMRDITQVTGGQTLDGNRPQEALTRLAEAEDIYYILTYVPAEGSRRNRKIDIRMNRPDLGIIHGRRLEMEKLPEIRILEASCKEGILRLQLENMYRLNKGGASLGQVRVTVYNVPDSTKPATLLLEKELETTGLVELPLPALQPGRQLLAIKVQDLLTGREALSQVEIGIAAVPESQELIAILEKAAVYCDRLKKVAFHFVCRENVTQDILASELLSDTGFRYVRTTWLYDYQIVSRSGQINEQRVLLRKNRKNLRLENAALETRFRSFYTFYLPATLLGRDKQAGYIYELEDKEKLKKRAVARLSIRPKDSSSSITTGQAWIDLESGAVVKIKLDQRSIKGVETLEKKAQKSGARLQITDIHWYDVEKNGIFFPSETNILEYYVTEFKRADTKGAFTYLQGGSYSVTRGTNMWEASRTYVTFSDYQFFTVEVQVEEKTRVE